MIRKQLAVTHLATTLAIVFALLFPTGALAHGGGLDGLGCHHNRKVGGYHCHRGQLAGQHFQSKQGALKVLQGEGTNQPQASEPRRCCKVCRKGKPCGNSCIARWKNCTKTPGCACDR